ncbi:response regulator transcription factor [Marinoscillum sp.]|uniref:helix-turn-helix transcriptional regulator n=1 Tax=Marinoscillum sp. TaxID=2024838 RepID=UPI003BAC0511
MKKSYWIYGGATGILLLLLQVLHYRAIVRDLRLEVFGVVIAVIFMVLGVWVGIQLYKRRQTTVIDRSRAQALQLSARETEVLGLLVDGCSNQEIADRLFVSLNTTKTHLSNIYQKLNVSSRTQAIQKVRELASLSSPESTKK